MVHMSQTAAATITVEEVSHTTNYGRENLRVLHLMYYDHGHYDALVEVNTATTSMEPTRRSPLPLQVDDLQHLEFSSLYAPIAAYSPAYIASWTAQCDGNFVTKEESEELLRLAGWLLQLLCMPPPATHQFRSALRTWQAMLRRRLGGRLLPWPWSLVIYGLII